jgi:hypothetical protein
MTRLRMNTALCTGLALLWAGGVWAATSKVRKSSHLLRPWGMKPTVSGRVQLCLCADERPRRGRDRQGHGKGTPNCPKNSRATGVSSR